MAYRLKVRETKQFELYNDLETGDIVELGVFLKIDEIPRRSRKKIDVENLWVTITEVTYETKDLYRAVLKEEPRYLKHLCNGNQVAFSPENVLRIKRKITYTKAKGIKNFVYKGSNRKKACYKSIISDDSYSYAVDPSNTVFRSKERIKNTLPIDKIDDKAKKEMKTLIEKFDEVQLDKYNVRIKSDFIEKNRPKIRAKAKEKSLDEDSALIRISDRTYLSFKMVAKILKVVKEMHVYLEIYEGFPMLYFKTKKYDGFLSLTKQKHDFIIIDLTEKM